MDANSLSVIRVAVTSAANEMEKTAVPKWKRLQLAGELTKRSLKRLGKGGLKIDPTKELTGLRLGNVRIAKKLGVSMEDVSMGKALKGLIKDTKADNVTMDTVGRILGSVKKKGLGGVTMLKPQMSFLTGTPPPPKPSIYLAKSMPAGVKDIVRRHELMEAGKSVRQAKSRGRYEKAVMAKLREGKKPKGYFENLISAAHPSDKELSLLRKGPKRQVSTYAAALPAEGKMENLRSKIPRLRVVGGTTTLKKYKDKRIFQTSHVSPSILTRESEQVARMPESVQKALKRGRKKTGETEMLRRLGLEYGKGFGSRRAASKFTSRARKASI